VIHPVPAGRTPGPAPTPPAPPPDPPPVLVGERVTLSPVVPADAARLREIRALPEVARWWEDPPSRWPLDDRSSAVRFTVRLSGREEIIGFVQYEEESSSAHRCASLDVFLDPAVHGGGLGVDTVRTLARHLVEDRGHHRLMIDPAVDNLQAVRCYTLAGFRPVGVLRSYERDRGGGWRHGLLMDALAGEIPTLRGDGSPGPGTAAQPAAGAPQPAGAAGAGGAPEPAGAAGSAAAAPQPVAAGSAAGPAVVAVPGGPRRRRPRRRLRGGGR